MSAELERDDPLVIYSSDDYSTSSAWVEHLMLVRTHAGFRLRQVRTEGSDTGIVFESDEFVDGLGFWAAYDENTMYGGMDDDQLVFDKIGLINTYAPILADGVAAEFRRRSE